MAAAYDTYDYPSYWIGRDYEHESEVLAIRDLLKEIPEITSVLEIGAGYGRLVKTYSYRAKKVVVTDPSARLLMTAAKNLKSGKKYTFLQAKMDTLPRKFKKGTFNLIVIIRVLHHIEDLDSAFSIISRLLANRGYVILEFANKGHFKANVSEFLKGNFTFPLDIFPKNLTLKRKKKVLPFINYHPGVIEQKLLDNNLYILDKRSVSNLRSFKLKDFVNKNTMVDIEKKLQKPLSKINFGPSIFILAQKRI